MVDREVLEAHLQNLSSMLSVLRRHSGKPAEELERDIEALLAVEHALQVAIQNMLDIGGHVLVWEGLNEFDEYREIPLKLAKHGVISRNLGERLAKFAGLRNILVHSYLGVRTDLLCEAITAVVADLEEFASKLLPLCKSAKQGP